MDTAYAEFPLCAVAFRYRHVSKLTHRDFLGTLLSTGIRRDKIGDILCGEGFSVVFLHEEIADFICEQVQRVGGEGVTSERNYSGPLPLLHQYETIHETVASPRIDVLVKTLLRCSREKAAECIRLGLVSVDHLPLESVSDTISAPCTISIRGSGRYLIDQIGPQTKKGRLLTAKDVREVVFPRSMGNYRKDEVDDFLDLCADTIEELSNQNDENQRKMQVLAETIMDYRNQEDSIRSALISAQRMSESVISDARKQADDILEAARAEAATMHDKALADTAAEQEELKRVKQEVADFKAKLMSIYREHLTLIGVLESSSEPAPTPSAAPAVSVEPEESVAEKKSMPDPYDMPDFSSFELNED